MPHVEIWKDGKKVIDRKGPNAFNNAKIRRVMEVPKRYESEQFDKAFLEWLHERTKTTVKGFDEWKEQMKTLAAAARAGNYDEVIRLGPAVRDLYPEYVEEGSAYELIAEACLARGDHRSAARELERYRNAGGRSPRLLKKLARLEEQEGRKRDAALTLERLNYIYPVNDEELHRWLGDLWYELGNIDAAVREYSAVVAMKPLDRAASDPRIRAVAFFPRRVSAGWGKLREIRDDLVKFRQSGKPLVAYLRNPGGAEYYLATAAGKIYLAPEDLLDVKGLRAEAVFLRKTLDKLGIEVEIEHAGKYKDAGDIFTRTSMSPETREVLESVLDALYEDFLETVAAARRQDVETVRKRLFSGWVDRYENIGKRSGAYSSGCYDSMPYILLNYTGTLDSCFTLAHELGHSMHSWYSNHAQPYHLADYRILVAEVASTTNEDLLTHYLLSITDDRATRAYLIDRYLDSFRGTLFRQTMFAEYEKAIHEQVEAGNPLTADYLDETYYALTRLYFGDGVAFDEQDEAIASEWSRVDHFFYNFYVYKYATGISSAIAIASGLLTDGASALERYLGFLRGGCSKYPLELLRDAGVDLATPQPVGAALVEFEQLVGELEELTQ